HSIIDLLTNSSTEIFVNCEESVEPAKELLTELLKLNGSDKTCDEVFEVTLKEDECNIETYFERYFQYDNEEEYEDIKEIYDLEEGSYDDQQKKLKNLIRDYVDGKLNVKIDPYRIQKLLVITSKDEKYNHLIKLLDKFLNSPEHYEYSTD
ncbi:MAG: hypothetical protein QQN41_08160, partial [Nitrosopumilus sp.]